MVLLMPCDLQFLQLGTEEIIHTHRVPILSTFLFGASYDSGKELPWKRNKHIPPSPHPTPSQAKNVHFAMETYLKGKKASKCKLLKVIPFPLT